MTTRRFDIDAGFATSTVPTVEDAVNPEDTPNFGQVALKSSWGDHVTNITAVKAIAASDRFDGQVVSIDGQILYQFDSDSAATPDDDTVLQPDAGSGRWHKVTSGGSAGVSGISVEMVEQSCSLKHAGITVPEFDISLCEAFAEDGAPIEGFLLSAYVSGTAMDIAWNPKFLDSTNKNSHFEAGYAAVTGTDAANIDTEGTTKKIGSSATSWDKSAGTSVNSFIQHDLGSGNGISLAGHRQVLVFVNMPSVTNLSTISIRLSDEGDNPTNYEQYDASLQFDGSAFATGWNLVGFDLDGSSTTTGTGWAPTQLLRTFAIGVVTSSAAQTYTNIVFDSLVFVEDSGDTVIPSYEQIAQAGFRYAISDTSNREYMIISSASARVIGNITLAAGLTNGYAGGTASVVMRSQLRIDGNNRSEFNSTTDIVGASLSSGASDLTQNVCVSRTLNESLTNATIATTVQLSTELTFDVIDTPTATSVTAVDTVDQSAELLSGATLHVFEVYVNAGKRAYRYTGSDITLTSNSTWLSNVLTLPVSSGDATVVDTAIAAGGYALLIKAEDVAVELSCVSAGSNDSFSAVTIDEINLVDVGLAYPKPSAIYGHFLKLTPSRSTSTYGAMNVKQGAVGADLTVNGTGAASFARDFKNGQLAAGVFSDTNYLAVGTVVGDSALLNPDSGAAGTVAASFWIYPITASPAAHNMIIARDDTVNGYFLYMSATTRQIVLTFVGGSATVATSAALNVNEWSHVAVVMQDGGSSAIWVNTVKTSASGNTITASSSSPLGIGRRPSTASQPCADCYLADMVFWSGSLGTAALSDAEIQSIYNGGRHRILGVSPGPTYRGEVTNLSGLNLAMNVEVARTTNAVHPFLTLAAAVKTN